MLSFPRWRGVEVTTVHMELLRLPEEMGRGRGHRSLHPFTERGKRNSFGRLRTCWLPGTFVEHCNRLPSSGIDGSQRAHSDTSGPAIKSIKDGIWD